ncbi:glycoside hydrolase family 3 C-terminal domain-containing protein [Luteococcus peritonei]|uniref:Glycoside hydrolase family 3 C-terminal domain-containing protein n=1 Tax=Luteococcus peritonei TaxID=88874 RepID=A0ABW4RUY0_9ACTN
MVQIPVRSKIALTGGSDFWQSTAVAEAGLPRVILTDGPHGVRLQTGSTDHIGLAESEPATCFPPAVGLSSTWNRELAREVGRALGEEARSLKVGVLLGPGANIKRDPRCGRNFEYFSEDPYLTGELAAAYVEGVQSQGVGTSLKHFAANNQETDRMRRDSQVDERPLREIYLRGFSKVVRQAQPWTVMCSYNKLNGVQVSENRWLLTDVLRGEWGFEGLVVSDWGAVWDRTEALKAGLDLEMPAHAGHEAEVVTALEAGRIDEQTIDVAYQRIERVLRRAAETVADAPQGFDEQGHHELARRAAEQAIVLLSNDGALPLDPSTKVAVVGEFARTPRYQGAGSSRVNPTRLDNALDAINQIVGHEVPFAPGFTTAPGQVLEGDPVAEAVAVAREAELVLVFLGLGEEHESEGYDRQDIDLPAEQLELLDRVLEVNQQVVVVLSNGSSVAIPFAHRVRAVVEGWLLGQAGGPALADVLYGRVNPSGRLSETIPLQITDVPAYLNFPGDETGVRYGEGLFVGYRGYDALQREVAFPFGHGLSYTSFDYSEVAATAEGDQVVVEVSVTNTGERAGREVVQVYAAKLVSEVVRVPRELVGFEVVELEPGASQRVRVTVGQDELAFWSVLDQVWAVEPGEYRFEVGASSRDLRGNATVELAGTMPRRELTLMSTLNQAMAVPAFAEEGGPLVKQAFGGEEDGGPLGTDTLRMLGDIPLMALAGLAGRSAADFQQLLDRANQA